MECPHCHSQISSFSKLCKRCGGTIPSSQYLLEESGILEPTPTVIPARQTSDAVRNSSAYRFASLGDRFVAFALDIALLSGLFAVVDAWVFMRWGTFGDVELQLTTASLLIAVTLNATILFLYGWLLEALCGATLGKAMVGIRIVRTGRRSPLSASAIRNVLRIVDGLGFYLVGTVVAACSGVRQRIGDVFAQTAVVEESFGVAVRATTVVIWITTLAGAGWAVPRICSTTNSVHSGYLNEVVIRIGKTQDSAYIRIADYTVDVHSSNTH
jgi:uncharacterized RDD family membrane protein YckC